MLRGVLISDFDDGGVKLIFGGRALWGVWAWLLDDVLLLRDCKRFLLLDYLDGWLLVLLGLLLGFGWAVGVGLYALCADLLGLYSLVYGFIIGETFFVGCQGVKC